jgi:hypothetical protein
MSRTRLQSQYGFAKHWVGRCILVVGTNRISTPRIPQSDDNKAAERLVKAAIEDIHLDTAAVKRLKLGIDAFVAGSRSVWGPGVHSYRRSAHIEGRRCLHVVENAATKPSISPLLYDAAIPPLPKDIVHLYTNGREH